MEVIFGTTNKRKIEDLQNICDKMGLDLRIICLEDIGWDLGEIEENGKTVEENSLIKAQAIHKFCQSNNITFPIITDDAGLFCESLNGEPGVYTARYADDEIKLNPELPKYQCVYKLLRKLNGLPNRRATYRCCVTCMMSDGTYFQETGESNGRIASEIHGEVKKPYFYSVFVLDGYDKVFSTLDKDELYGTYRYDALGKALQKIKK